MACHPSPCNSTVWRAAIAINNIGWSLLERSCYDQAHQTLKDAARAMVALTNDCGEETQRAVESCLRAAEQRLAFPYRSFSLSSSVRENCPAPIRLDVEELAADTPVDFVAIAVHNSAVSYFYQSTSDANAPEVQKHLMATAVSLLQSSYSMISAPPTLAHALHILENLRKVTRWSIRTGVALGALRGGRPDTGGMRGLATLEELDAELAHLRALVDSLGTFDLPLFGHSVFAAAA